MSKRQRTVQSISGIGGISDSALAKVLKFCRETPEILEDPLSARYISKATNALAKYVCTTQDLLLNNGRMFEWTYAHPQRLVTHLCQEHVYFWRTLRQLHACRPSSRSNPWHIVLYCDELTPGAQLTPLNWWKSWSFLVTIREFRGLLGKDAAWLPLGLLRTSICKSVRAGVSAAIRWLMRRLLLGPDSISTAGLPVCNGSESFMIFAIVSNILGDEAALCRVFSGKSASGLLPCLECSNAWDPTKCEPRRVDSTGYFVELDCTDFKQFVATTNEEHWEKNDMLREAKPTMSKGKFKALQTNLGRTFDEESLVSDIELRPHAPPSELITMDSQHTVFQNGWVAVEIMLFLETARQLHQIKYIALETFLFAEWNHAKHLRAKSRSLYHLFSIEREKSNRDAFSFKGSSSDILAVYPMIRAWIELHIKPKGWLVPQVRAFELMCRAADLVRHNRGCVSALPRPAFLQAAQQHMEAHKVAYPENKLIPKHHYSSHLVISGLDCWACERQHGGAKDQTENIQNTVSWEASAIVRMLLEKKRRLNDPACFAECLCEPIEDSLELSSLAGSVVRCSRGMVCGAGPVSRGDVVQICNSEITIGIVDGCVSVHDVFGIVLEELVYVDSICEAAVRKMARSGIMARVQYNDSTRIIHACAWDNANDRHLNVVW